MNVRCRFPPLGAYPSRMTCPPRGRSAALVKFVTPLRAGLVRVLCGTRHAAARQIKGW